MGINDDTNPIDTRKRVFGYYGTFWRTLITMFEITFANWIPSCRILVDHLSEFFGLFFLSYRVVIGTAVLSVVQAVFIQSTMKAAQANEEIVLQAKNKEKQSYIKRVKKMFMTLDESGDGFVSWDEFKPLLTDPSLGLMMSTLELDAKDAEMMWTALDNGDGQLSADEFVQGAQSIKGTAKALDMVAVLNKVTRIERLMLQHERRLQDKPESKLLPKDHSGASSDPKK